LKILIANNSSILKSGFYNTLSNCNEEIEKLFFDTPRQAVKMLDSDSSIDIVISGPEEIEDPKINLLRQIKGSTRFSWIPVLVVGNSFGDGSIERLIREGVTDIIIPPIKSEDLNGRIKSAIEKGRRKILVVDDNIDLVNILKIFLEMERYTIFTAETAEQGETILNSTKINAVISDIMLPEMSGIEFMSKMKASHSNLPFILITGYFENYTPKDIISAGAAGYFIKPINNRELANTLRQILSAT
jgi:DNA-binding NtrC family response regulator